MNDTRDVNLRRAIYKRDKGICWVCHEFVEFDKDYDLGHIIDKCNGGSYEPTNLTVMHHKCNLSKPEHKTIEEAIRWQMSQNISIFNSNEILPPKVLPIEPQNTLINKNIPFDIERFNQLLSNQNQATQPIQYMVVPRKKRTRISNITNITPNITDNTVMSIEKVPESLRNVETIITWRQGHLWEAITPPYDKIYHLEQPLPGTTKFASGKGSAQKTLQIIGKPINTDVAVNCGWAMIYISFKDNEPTIKYAGGREAVTKRWIEDKKVISVIPNQPVSANKSAFSEFLSDLFKLYQSNNSQ
jgi:hypothetical protein